MKKQNKNIIIENILFSQLSYLVIFVMIICITERKSLKEDPLNFTVLNICLWKCGIINGYSCKRRLKTDEICQDKWYGFCGRWSNGGKFALIIVMFYGRLKSFSMHGGNAWRILS
ncbi:putative cation transporter HKT7 [Bienertia sinuspersici]